MPIFFSSGPRISLTLLGVVALSSPCLAQKKESSPRDSRHVQEEVIREAAFLYLFTVGTGPDPDHSFYCLSVDSEGAGDHQDPSDSLMKRLASSRHTLRKFSECEVATNRQALPNDDDLFGRVKDKESGGQAWLISIGPISWVNNHKVRLEGERYCGSLCGWRATLQLTLRGGKWIVTIAPGTPILVS